MANSWLRLVMIVLSRYGVPLRGNALSHTVVILMTSLRWRGHPMASALPLVLGILCKYGKLHELDLLKRSQRICQASRPYNGYEIPSLLLSLITEVRVHRVVHDGRDDV